MRQKERKKDIEIDSLVSIPSVFVFLREKDRDDPAGQFFFTVSLITFDDDLQECV